MLQKCLGNTSIWVPKNVQLGHKVIENLHHVRRPSISANYDNIEKVKKETVLENRHWLDRPKHILVNVLDMKRVNARLIPKDLNFLQKQSQVEVLGNIAEGTTCIKCIITGDNTWVYEYDVQTAQQASECTSKNGSKSKKKQNSPRVL